MQLPTTHAVIFDVDNIFFDFLAVTCNIGKGDLSVTCINEQERNKSIHNSTSV